MIGVLESKRLQARTCLIIIDTIDIDYCSCGHTWKDVLWWWEDEQIETRSGDKLHGDILGGYMQTQEYIRGRYDITSHQISLLPDNSDTAIPREVFRALEKEFPGAVEIALY